MHVIQKERVVILSSEGIKFPDSFLVVPVHVFLFGNNTSDFLK